MLFFRRLSLGKLYTGNALGASVSWEITRDFFLDNVIVELSGTVSTAAATPTADGILGLAKRLQLSIADGATNRNQTDASGVGLIQSAFNDLAGIDQGTLNTFLRGNVTGSFLIRVPLLFLCPQLKDPAASAFMLPLPRYNTNPTLTLTLASQADMDSNATPTFAIAGGINARLIINKRQVDDVNFPTWEHEFIEASKTYPTTEPQALYNLQVPGTYFAFGMRGYTSLNSWGDISSAGGLVNLSMLGSNLINCRFADLQYINQLSVQDNWSATTLPAQTNGLFPGLAVIDFLSDSWGGDVSEVNSALNSNILAGSGSNVELKQDVTGGANVRQSYFWRRIFGNLEPLTMSLRG